MINELNLLYIADEFLLLHREVYNFLVLVYDTEIHIKVVTLEFQITVSGHYKKYTYIINMILYNTIKIYYLK